MCVKCICQENPAVQPSLLTGIVLSGTRNGSLLTSSVFVCLFVFSIPILVGFLVSPLLPSRLHSYSLQRREGGRDECNERHSFHARVGRFSPFLYLRSVAIAVILFWLQLVVLVFPCFLGSRIPRDYRFPSAPLFLCSERKPSSLTTGSSKL